MPMTVTGFLTDPAGFGRTIAQLGRRATSTNLRQQGEQAALLGQNYASELGPSRVGNRRRDKGVSYRNGFEVVYTGLDDFAAGEMRVSVRNRSRHARIIETGSSAHDIEPSGKFLAWPNPPNRPGPAAVFVRRVGRPETATHPGTEPHHILRRAALDAMSNGFVGKTLGHASINIRVGR